MQAICLDGKSFEDSSPFNLAGGVMFMHRKRDKPEIDWAEFKRTTNMGEIKAFSELMNEPRNRTLRTGRIDQTS